MIYANQKYDNKLGSLKLHEIMPRNIIRILVDLENFKPKRNNGLTLMIFPLENKMIRILIIIYIIPLWSFNAS